MQSKIKICKAHFRKLRKFENKISSKSTLQIFTLLRMNAESEPISYSEILRGGGGGGGHTGGFWEKRNLNY